MADLGNLQAILVRGSAKPFFALLLFTIGDIPGARRFLRQALPMVPAGAAAETAGVAALHVMLSWSGIEKLLAGQAGLDVAQGRDQFEAYFTEPVLAPDSPGMARPLGFVGQSDPATWWHEFATRDVELALHGAFDTPEHRDASIAALRASALACGLTERRVASFPDGAIAGYRPAGGRLHFGYRDGITALDIDWDDARRPGSVDRREIVTGYPSDAYRTAPFPPGPWRDFSRDGSYACLTWIYQDAARFEAFLEAKAAGVAAFAGAADPKEWLAARLLGRWRNGTPVVRHPGGATEPPDLDDSFDYADDPSGHACPLTAHIRVVNARKQPLNFPNRRRFPNGPPRLLRRGFSYGPPWQGPGDDGVDRGLAGLFFCARVNEQFYTILRWMHETSFSDAFENLEHGLLAQDALVADRAGEGSNIHLHLAAQNGRALDVELATFLRYRGVAILFAPGMKALATLSGA